MNLYEKACAMYEVLASQADDDVFTGSITKAYDMTGLNAKFYSPVMATLRATGSIEVEQRGSRVKGTIIRLHGLPTEEAYQIAVENGLTAVSARVSIDHRVSEIERRLRAIEDRLTTVEGG